MLLPPGDVQAALEQRAASLRQSLAEVEKTLADNSSLLPRVTLLDDEYLRAVTTAELNWIDGVLDDLRSGGLAWTEEQLTGAAMESLGGLASDLPPGYLPE
jgi:hypothetical protein